jgi:hypothetical protein
MEDVENAPLAAEENEGEQQPALANIMSTADTIVPQPKPVKKKVSPEDKGTEACVLVKASIRLRCFRPSHSDCAISSSRQCANHEAVKVQDHGVRKLSNSSGFPKAAAKVQPA